MVQCDHDVRCGTTFNRMVTTMDNRVPKTISVPEAGRIYFDLARNAAYEAAHRGDIPVIKVGRKLRVPVVAMERMLDEARPTPREAA